jgi:GDPmannose 4,6-dehydratase
VLFRSYEVHGVIRRSSTFNTRRIDHIYQEPDTPNARLFLHYGDLASVEWALNLVYSLAPDEIYNLAAQSHVKVSFEMPDYTGDVTGLATTRLLEAIRCSGSKARFYQASSSEMFGAALPPQNEATQFQPRSPYGVAKLHAYWMTRIYREGYGLFASNGILFNHESPRRGETFVTRKITRGLARILAGQQEKLVLGNLDARRDWGYAPEYVNAMWLMLQQDCADDFVIGTGESHSIREFVEEAFDYVDLDWRDFVEFHPRYVRPLEVEYLLADAAKAREQLQWSPHVTFRELVTIMVDADLEANGVKSPGAGSGILESKLGPWNQWQNSVSAVASAIAGRASD